MSRYHQRTLSLLGIEPESRSVDSLLDWAEENDIRLPAAYLEWATIDDGTLLEKYTNDDSFWFDDLNLGCVIEMDDGTCGLRFNSENQGNFDRIVMLDQGDDPPVLFSWVGREPWVVNAERFSDAVFAQVFDWQYQLEFSTDDPEYREMAYTGDISLKSERCLPVLQRRYDEEVTTRFVVETNCFTERRFAKSTKERINVTVADDHSAEIRITGQGGLVPALEAELLDLLADDVVPPSFNSVGWVAGFLDSRIRNNWRTQLRHAFLESPTSEAIDRLIACQLTQPIRDRAHNLSFPHRGQRFRLGSPDWGVAVTLLRQVDDWWRLESIT